MNNLSNTIKKVLSLLLFSPFIFSCDKEKEVQISPLDHLTGGNVKYWKFKKWENADYGNYLEVYSHCMPDDIILFQKIFSGNRPEISQIWRYNWTFCFNENKEADTSRIAIKGNMFYVNDYPYTIITLNDSIFEIGDERNHIIYERLLLDTSPIQ